jgi:preprotein translocase subunit Sec63
MLVELRKAFFKRGNYFQYNFETIIIEILPHLWRRQYSMNIKDAYKILGLEEGATREEVNKRFDLLLRQSRSKERTSDSTSDSDISQAYRQIIDHENALIIEQKRQEHYNKWGREVG